MQRMKLARWGSNVALPRVSRIECEDLRDASEISKRVPPALAIHCEQPQQEQQGCRRRPLLALEEEEEREAPIALSKLKEWRKKGFPHYQLSATHDAP